MPFIKGHKNLVSKEARKRAGKKMLGNKINVGRVPWNKGKKYSSKHKGKKLSEAHKEALRVPRKGAGVYKRTEYHKEICRRNTLKGHLHKIFGFRKKKYYLTGEKNNNWKGGITPINEKARKSIEYRLWRESVFARDNWTCQKCVKKGGDVHAHHIKPFGLFPELHFAIDNGITFCIKCHRLFHKTYGYKKINKKQIDEFIQNNKITN